MQAVETPRIVPNNLLYRFFRQTIFERDRFLNNIELTIHVGIVGTKNQVIGTDAIDNLTQISFRRLNGNKALATKIL